MKLLIVICFVYCVVSAYKLQPIEEINSTLIKVLTNISLLQIQRIGYFDCYNIYIPEITQLAEDGKRQIEVCLSSGNLSRTIIKGKYNEEQTRINSDIEKLEQALQTCTNPEEAMTYLACINDYSGQYLYYIDSITTTSSTLLYKIKTKFALITQQETSCVDVAMNDTKTKTNQSLSNLQNCLTIGSETV